MRAGPRSTHRQVHSSDLLQSRLFRLRSHGQAKRTFLSPLRSATLAPSRLTDPRTHATDETKG